MVFNSAPHVALHLPIKAYYGSGAFLGSTVCGPLTLSGLSAISLTAFKFKHLCDEQQS